MKYGVIWAGFPVYTWRRPRFFRTRYSEVAPLMSLRLACLLSIAILGASAATPTLAKTKHSTHHTKHAKVVKAPALIWRGDVATAQGITEDMASAWKKAGHEPIEVQVFNTASGLDAVRTGAADLGGSARGSAGNPNENGLTFTPVGWDGLVIITNSANPASNMTLQQVHDVYYGKITNWKELGGKDEPIDVYAVASPDDGVEYSLRKLIFGRGNQPVAAPRLYLNTAKLQAGVALDPAGFGVTTLSNASGVSKLKMLDIDGIKPSLATISNGSYLLFSPLYVVTNSSSAKAAQSQAFVDFLGSDPAKAVMREHSILPYAEGSLLASMDDSRRQTILAQTGARVPRPTPSSTPISAPGATYAARVAQAPTSERTAEAKDALAKRNAEQVAKQAEVISVADTPRSAAEAKATDPTTKPDEAKVATPKQAKTDAPDAPKPGLDEVSANAVTLERPTTDTPFAKVRSGAQVTGGAQYTVHKGDTLYSISQTHSVAVAELRRWNHLTGDDVQPGQQLQISAR